MGYKVGRRFTRQGTHVYLWPIHADMWQKQIQYYKAIILHLKIKLLKIIPYPKIILVLKCLKNFFK